MEHTQTPAEVQAVIIGKMEAAKVDGANTWQLFKHIQIPAIMLMVDFVLFDNIRGALQVFDIPLQDYFPAACSCDGNGLYYKSNQYYQ